MISIIPSVFLHMLRRNLKFMDENAFEHKKNRPTIALVAI